MIMAKDDYYEKEKIVIDLSGPKGNAFYLLGLAKYLCEKVGRSKSEMNELLEEMQEGDYENLVETLDFHFGKLLVILR